MQFLLLLCFSIGRAYILFMLWGTATAMLITNTVCPKPCLLFYYAPEDP